MVEDGRRRNLWPMPGGTSAYVATTRMLLGEIGKGVRRADFEAMVRSKLPNLVSSSTTRGYVSVLVTLGFAELKNGSLQQTDSGKRFSKTGDLRLLRAALTDRVLGITEILEVIGERPMAYPELRDELEHRGIAWNNAMAVRYRVWWLVAAEALKAERIARADLLTITRAGRACVRAQGT